MVSRRVGFVGAEPPRSDPAAAGVTPGGLTATVATTPHKRYSPQGTHPAELEAALRQALD